MPRVKLHHVADGPIEFGQDHFQLSDGDGVIDLKTIETSTWQQLTETNGPLHQSHEFGAAVRHVAGLARFAAAIAETGCGW
jgi:hypothetical protein